MHSPARGGVGRATRGLGLKDEEARDGGGTPGKGSVEGNGAASHCDCKTLELALNTGRQEGVTPA